MLENRPWGNFQVIHEEKGLKVKIIEVDPGKRLSLQSHAHRSERWVIIEGTAEIIIDNEKMMKQTGEVVRIEVGQKHRLINPGESTLRLIEVQMGVYLEEDDIVRYEDDFGRV